MGGDGGSIPMRDDLVKTKCADAKVADTTRLRQLWSFCALSKQPLQAPIVSCALGKLYNKDALLTFLLSPSSSPYGNDGHLIASHIRSLRDVTTLHLTPNPTLLSQSTAENISSTLIGTQESRPTSLFVDPISLRELNGSIKVVYRKPCGCVLTEVSLREMRRGAGQDVDLKVCPVSGKRDEDGKGGEEWVTINPREEEAEEMRERWEKRVEVERVEKEERKKAKAKDKKRKGVEGEGGDAEGNKKAKSAKVTAALGTGAGEPAPSIKAGATVPRLSATLAQKLAEQKKSHSPAVASLYAPKDDDPNHDKNGRSTWMTRGAFTRFA